MTDNNPFRAKTNDPKRLAARHMASQYFDLLDDLNNARIDAGLTFDQLAKQLPYSASELRTKLSQSAHELDFLTLHIIANMTGHKYEIKLVPYDKQVGNTESIHEASKDQPDPVLVIHNMADSEGLYD